MSRKRTPSKVRPVVVDLFCGAGGMSLGFEQAGFDVLLGVDSDGYHVATHDRNFPYGRTLCRSVADLSASDVFEALDGRTEVDVVVGGPPCQGFSHMGVRDAGDPRNTLVGQFVRLVCEIRPKAFVMENVPGMLSGATAEVLTDAVSRFEAAGYRITHPVRVLDASRYGVPQKRKRLILLGIRNDIPQAIDYPPPVTESPTVWDAIGDLPNVDRHDELFARNDVPYETEPTTPYARRLRGTAADRTDYSYRRVWDSGRCVGCLRVRHTPAAVALYDATAPGEMVPSHKLPRLDPNGLAPTLRAGSDSSHGSYTAPRPIHPFHPRCITAREAARLHGFPDWFAFYPSKWHAYRQIGNAVCPPVAKAIGAKVLEAIGIAPHRPTDPISMPDDFHLPAERPRGLKRIPQVVHFPPVIERLFAERFDSESGRLRLASFTFADVQRAVAATGVQLTWIRADTFLSEISRSRNVRKLLEPCLRFGYTIRKCADADVIGEFIPVSHPDGIERKAVAVRRPHKAVRSKESNRGQKTRLLAERDSLRWAVYRVPAWPASDSLRRRVVPRRSGVGASVARPG